MEDETENETKLNEHIMIVARMSSQFKSLLFLNLIYFLNLENLMDVSKGQELMKNLIKLFKENINLKNHFKNLVNPSCSCNKSLELIVSDYISCLDFYFIFVLFF